MSDFSELNQYRKRKVEAKKMEASTKKTSGNIIPKTVLEFNKELLPSGVREWCEDVATRMNNAPLVFASVSALVVLSSAIGARVGVRPKLLDEWTVIPNLWGMLIAPPSVKKSPIYGEMIKPLVKAEKEANEKYITEMIAYKKEMMLYKSDLKECLKSKEGTIPDEPIMPTRDRYLTNDATIEAVAQIMIENPYGLFVTFDELSGFFKTLTKAGREGDQSFWLEAFNGNGSKSIDRIGRGSTFVPNVCASIFGTIQPDVLMPMLNGVKGGSNGGDGFLQRFQLAVMVEQSSFQYIDRKPNYIAKREYSEIVQSLLTANPLEYGAFKNEYDDTLFFEFSKEASEIFKNFEIENNKKVRIEQEHNPILSSHFGKYPSLMASIALILFYVDRVRGITSLKEIPKECALKAVQWCELLESHSRNIYDLDRIAEAKRDLLDEKIIAKTRELQTTGQLPMTFGRISQLILGANANAVKKALDGLVATKGKKVYGFL